MCFHLADGMIWPSGDNPISIEVVHGVTGNATYYKLPKNLSLSNGSNFSMSAILSNPSCRLQTISKSCTQADSSSCNTPVQFQPSSGLSEFVSDTSLSNSFRLVGNTSKTTISSRNGSETMQTTMRSPLFDISGSLEPQSSSLMRRHSVPKMNKASVAVPNTSTSSAGKKRSASSYKSELCFVGITIFTSTK